MSTTGASRSKKARNELDGPNFHEGSLLVKAPSFPHLRDDNVRTSRDDLLRSMEHEGRGLARVEPVLRSYDERILAESFAQDQVTEFLLSLPLSGTMQDSAIEASVGDHLLLIYKEKAALQAKLEDWIDAASELHDIASDQQAELKALQNPSLEPVAACVESSHSAPSRSLWQEVMQPQQEIAELRGVVLSLQDGFDSRNLLSPQRLACNVILDKLHSMQRQLICLNEAHDLSLQKQADLHSNQLEKSRAELSRLQHVLADQDDMLHEGNEERERLLTLQAQSEAQLDDYYQSTDHLAQMLQEKEREIQGMRAARASSPFLDEARDEEPANAFDSRASSPVSACGKGKAGEEATCLMPESSEMDDTEKVLMGLRAPVEAEDASRNDYLALQICSEAWQLQLATQVERLRAQLTQARQPSSPSILAGASVLVSPTSIDTGSNKVQSQEEVRKVMRIEVLANSGMHFLSPRSYHNGSTTLTPTLSLEDASISEYNCPADQSSRSRDAKPDQSQLAGQDIKDEAMLPPHEVIDLYSTHAAEIASLQVEKAKTDAVERLEAAFLRAQEELGFTHGRLEATEDELAECQEMLEELQSKSLEQSYHLTALQNQIKDLESAKSSMHERLQQTLRELCSTTDQMFALKREAELGQLDGSQMRHCSNASEQPDVIPPAKAVAALHSQEKLVALELKVAEQEQIIHQLTAEKSRPTPQRRASILSKSTAHLPALPAAKTPQSQGLKVSRPSSEKSNKSIKARTPQSFAQASLSLSSLPQSPGEAVRHLHFNPVYSEPGFLRQLPSQLLKGSGRPLRSAGQENKAATPSGKIPSQNRRVPPLSPKDQNKGTRW